MSQKNIYNMLLKNKKININIVVSRYNENLEWLNQEPFNNFFIIIYNKGINDNFKIYSPHKIIKLDNVGKCDHTYLYHIINNYNNLPDIIIFLPGSCNINYKLCKSIKLINLINKYNMLINIGVITKHCVKDIYNNFKIDNWKTSDINNYSINNITDTEKSKIRPFSKWYKYHFKDTKVNFISWYGIFAISNTIVLQKPKEYYKIFLDELSNSSNPEVGHYIERAWFAIFDSTNCQFINYFSN